MGKKVLVADSDGVIQQVASYFLKLEGFEVETAGDGASAMEAIEKTVPDVIVIDPVLPGINGVEVSHFVGKNSKYMNIPIVFLAESEEPLLNETPELVRQFGIVNKPIDPTRLVNTIKESIERCSAPAGEIVESLKSIEELLGWDVPDRKMMEKEKDYPEFTSESEIMPDCEIPEQVWDDIGAEFTGNSAGTAPISMVGSGWEMNSCSTAGSENNTIMGEHVQEIRKLGWNDSGPGAATETAGCAEADIRSMITDEMIESVVKKMAADIVERVAREIVPDLAEREILKEIERLKGTE